MAIEIPKDEQQNVLENFWTMLQECEKTAECDNDPILKHWVEQWYDLWNRLNSTNYKPRWLNT